MRLLILIGRIAPTILVFAFPVFFALLALFYLFLSPIDKDSEEVKLVSISDKNDYDEIAKALVDAGVARSAFAMSFYLNRKHKELEEKGKIGGGEYRIPLSLRPTEIVNILFKGEVVQREFSIKAGNTYEEIIGIIVASGLFLEDEIRNAFTDRTLLLDLNIGASIPEGYFLPGKYRYTKPIKASEVASNVLKVSQSKRNRVFQELETRARKLGVDTHGILTIASLVQKDSASPSDKKKIASVIYNRLALDLPLENEMSLRYLAMDFTKPVSDLLKRQPSPYNTFIRPGLPATPICTPNIESIASALYPRDTDYLYYLKNSDGDYLYASSKKEYEELLKSLK